MYQAKQKLNAINQANKRTISSEDLIKFAHRISADNSVAAPSTWALGMHRVNCLSSPCLLVVTAPWTYFFSFCGDLGFMPNSGMNWCVVLSEHSLYSHWLMLLCTGQLLNSFPEIAQNDFPYFSPVFHVEEPPSEHFLLGKVFWQPVDCDELTPAVLMRGMCDIGWCWKWYANDQSPALNQQCIYSLRLGSFDCLPFGCFQVIPDDPTLQTLKCAVGSWVKSVIYQSAQSTHRSVTAMPWAQPDHPKLVSVLNTRMWG